MATPRKPGSKKPTPISKARSKRKPAKTAKPDELNFPAKKGSLSERLGAPVTDIRDAVDKAMTPKKVREHHGPKQRKAGDPPQAGFWDKVVHDVDYMAMVRRRAEIESDEEWARLEAERGALTTKINEANKGFGVKVGKRLRVDDGEADTDFVVLEGVERSGGGQTTEPWSKVAATFKYVRTE